MEFIHIPVLLSEAIDALNITKGKTYFDCTAGGGGHASKVLEKLDGTGRLILIDRDPDAIEHLKKKFAEHKNVTIIHDNFFNIKEIAERLNISGADGILADLGVSSYQLDTADRGFSYNQDSYLDMRMNRGEGLSAYDVVNTLSKDELRKIIYKYGEEKFANSIANKIVTLREKSPIKTTFELNDAIRSAIPAAARRDGHPSRKTYQAIRYFCNNELDMLESTVEILFNYLNPGGRLAVITFNSLEDRPVKQLFARLSNPCECPKSFPVCCCGKKPLGISFKSVAPTKRQIEENHRCRSSRLRFIEKI